MDPLTIVNSAIAALDGILSIINSIRGQAGMTDDQILAAAEAQTVANSDQIKQLLANLPPQS